jgi:glucans biosynthesis protein
MEQFERHGRGEPASAFELGTGDPARTLSRRPAYHSRADGVRLSARTLVRLPRAKLLWCLCVVLFCVFYVGDDAVEADTPFGFDNVRDQAKKLAGQPFKPPPAIPDFLSQISYDQYRDIRFDPALSLWRDTGSKFQVQFIHPGLFYRRAVAVNTYDGSGIRRVPFAPKLFTYGRNAFADKIPVDLGFAGLRIAYPLYKASDYNHVLVFAGASYFRAVAKNQTFGLSARGLALDTGLPSGEEFPFFKEFWLERPSRDATVLKILALLDSPRVAGAYEFVLRVAARTLVDVRAMLFERKRATELGIAPLTSMFFYGEERARPASEWRPEVHDSDGLLISASTGEWIWRPLVNPERLLVSYFELDSPRGFGLLQRDRSFHAYEDLEARYDLRPNAWVTPTGSWGKGQLKLVQIPTPNETNDNIVAYWIPGTLPPVGQPIEVAYRIHFQSEDPLPAASGRATATRVGDGDTAGLKRIVVDFAGGKLKQLPAGAQVKPVIIVGSDAQLVQQSALRNSVTGGFRLAFQVKPPKGKPVEFRAFLQHDRDTLTETWSYLLPP